MVDCAQPEWRLALVSDVGIDSFQQAIDGLDRLRDAMKSATVQDIAERLPNGSPVAVEDHRHILRWIHRVGYWIDQTPELTPTERLQRWLLSGDLALHSGQIAEIWKSLRKSVPRTGPDCCLKVNRLIQQWQSLLNGYGWCLPEANLKNFPRVSWKCPYRGHAEWQNYSDGSYLSEWMNRVSRELGRKTPEAKQAEGFLAAACDLDRMPSSETPGKSPPPKIVSAINHWLNVATFHLENDALSRSGNPHR